VFRPCLEGLEHRLVPSVLHVGASEPYHTITSAVNAAHPGDTIRVDPGVYQEQVFLTKNDVTLQGVNQAAVIKAPSTFAPNTYALVEVDGAKDVTISNLTVEGPYAGGFTNVNGYLLGMHAGIFVAGGGSATITNNHVTNITDSTLNKTVDDGFGILIGSHVLNQTGTAIVKNNVIDNYMQMGIDVAHNGSFASITGNTVTGLGPALGPLSSDQVGIDVEHGGRAQISNNVVSKNFGNAAGIALQGAAPGVSVNSNKVFNNVLGILTSGVSGVFILHNAVSGNTSDGIAMYSSSGMTVSGNSCTNNGGNGISLVGTTHSTIQRNVSEANHGDGIFADAGSVDNFFLGNILANKTSNGLYDAEDDSSGSGTAGTGNVWSGNVGKTDNHGGALLL
jgi:parallel beta-helix repeat protein